MAHRGVSVKTLKRMLKKKGLKTTGRKAALTRRAKKAKLMKGGVFIPRPGVVYGQQPSMFNTCTAKLGSGSHCAKSCGPMEDPSYTEACVGKV